jgi:hypothetical protein
VESALAFYDKVVDIWYKFLASVRGDAHVADGFGEAQLSEVHNSDCMTASDSDLTEICLCSRQDT